MTDRADLLSRAKRKVEVVRVNDAPVSLADYKRRKELQAYEDRMAGIRLARREIERQRARRDQGRPGWLFAYLVALALIVTLMLARSCSGSAIEQEVTDGPPVSIQPGN